MQIRYGSHQNAIGTLLTQLPQKLVDACSTLNSLHTTVYTIHSTIYSINSSVDFLTSYDKLLKCGNIHIYVVIYIYINALKLFFSCLSSTVLWWRIVLTLTLKEVWKTVSGVRISSELFSLSIVNRLRLVNLLKYYTLLKCLFTYDITIYNNAMKSCSDCYCELPNKFFICKKYIFMKIVLLQSVFLQVRT